MDGNRSESATDPTRPGTGSDTGSGPTDSRPTTSAAPDSSRTDSGPADGATAGARLAAAADRAADRAIEARDDAVEARDDATEARDDATEARDDAADASRAAGRSQDRAADAASSAEIALAEVGEIVDGDPILDEAVRKHEAGVDEENPFGRPGRPMSQRSPFRVGFGAAIGVGLAYLLYQALINAQSVLVLVVIAAFFAIGLNPTVSRLERLGLRRGAAVGVVFLGVALFFTVVGYAILPPLIEQGERFIRALPGYVNDLQKNPRIADLDERFGIIKKTSDYLTNRLGPQTAGNILSIGSTIASTVFKGLTILILTLYFLSSFNAITHTAYRMVPRSRRARATLLGDEILGRVGGYVAGAFIVALIAGTTSLIWLSALGVPYPLALALVVMISDIIPLIGATIGAVLVTIVTLIHSIPIGIATFIFFMVYQQVENYLVYPRVMKRSVDINPAAAIVGALVGGTLLGIVGALIAVPVTAAIQLIVREVVLPRQDSA
ncbi:MAG TPA: AI-2E family transporter [Mycobacteriales bacterium]|nr:AI-2E family transporter [Mycobacteriales bacterium]